MANNPCPIPYWFSFHREVEILTLFFIISCFCGLFIQSMDCRQKLQQTSEISEAKLKELRQRLEERCPIEWMDYCQDYYSDNELIEIIRYKQIIEQLCQKPWTKCSNNNTLIEMNAGHAIDRKPGKALLVNVFSKFCPLSLRTVNFSHNRITGTFPKAFIRCSGLEILDLSHNHFYGSLPAEIQKLKKLGVLNLSYNKFSGELLDNDYFRRFDAKNFEKSGLCARWIALQHPPCEFQPILVKTGAKSRPILVESEAMVVAGSPKLRRKLKTKKFALIAGLAALGIVLIIVFPVIYVCCMHFRRPDLLPSWLVLGKFKYRFTVAMLKAATKGFADENHVGSDPLYDVYRGVLVDETEVAVKIMRKELREQLRASFLDSCKSLVQLEHENVMRVLGWCDSQDFLSVVVEWKGNGTLENWLLDPNHSPSWSRRLHVAVQIADALWYLDSHCPALRWDLKATNILLDKDFGACVSEFQPQAVNPDREEAGEGGGESPSPDNKVYGYGLLLLELITNKRPVESSIRKLRKAFPDKATTMMDPALIKKITTDKRRDQAVQLMDVALICTSDLPEGRPSMEKVVSMVDKVRKCQWVLQYCKVQRPLKRHGHHEETSGERHKLRKSLLIEPSKRQRAEPPGPRHKVRRSLLIEPSKTKKPSKTNKNSAPICKTSEEKKKKKIVDGTFNIFEHQEYGALNPVLKKHR